MNVSINRYKKAILLSTLMIGMSVGSALLAKCKPCAAAAAIRQSIRDAAAAALAAGKPISREAELDTFDPEIMAVIEACCSDCAERGIYCDGEYSGRCNSCQAALLKISIAEVAAALAEASASDAAMALDIISVPTTSRAPREELVDPCNTCATATDNVDTCSLNEKLNTLLSCCICTNKNIHHQARDAKKSYKKLRHEINEVEELVESQIDQSAECCSVIESLIGSQIDQSAECCSIIETRIGDLDGSAIDIPSCDQRFSIVDVIDNTNVDVVTWLKSLYVLLYQVYLCSCLPCEA
ncbi:MAG TPA: hypothetical protein VLB80_03540 [Candidatus Babeliales bacterium]|nr:hypothetical protein [Candidatus Babeliales bacterium]